MKVFEITIKPISGFGTPLKGDTIFGHFCWQVFYDPSLIGMSIEELLSSYQTNPLIIFSSAFPKFFDKKNGKYSYALKTPNLPIETLFKNEGDKKDKIKKRKENKDKTWMIINESKKILSFSEIEFFNDEGLYEKIEANFSKDYAKTMKKAEEKKFNFLIQQYHNKINRYTGLTGGEGFAPFAVEQNFFYPEAELVIFVGIDETVFQIEQVKEGLKRIGQIGFGKDASTGLGRFEIKKESEINLASLGSDKSNACYTLSPCIPQKNVFSDMYFTPFTRFGRHGDMLAKSSNPFKNPVIMADDGGIFKYNLENINKESIVNKHYIGTAILGVSKAESKTVSQGYSLYIPVEV